MLYTSCCILHTPCAITCLLLRTCLHLMSTTQLDRSRSPTMPCIIRSSLALRRKHAPYYPASIRAGSCSIMACAETAMDLTVHTQTAIRTNPGQKTNSCSVCLEVFTETKIWPCCHTFCLKCLEKIAQKKGELSYMTTMP